MNDGRKWTGLYHVFGHRRRPTKLSGRALGHDSGRGRRTPPSWSWGWWERPTLDGIFFFRVRWLPEAREGVALGRAGQIPYIDIGYEYDQYYWTYSPQDKPQPEEGRVACFLTRPPPVRKHIDFAECVPPEDRCPGTLLEILGALKTPTFASLRTEALGLDLSEEAYDLLARRGIKTARDLRREVATKMSPVLAAIRAGPG